MVKKQFLIILTDPHFEEIIFFFFLHSCVISHIGAAQFSFHVISAALQSPVFPS